MKKAARTQNKSERTERLQLLVRPEELVAIDDFQFARHIPTRAAAVRELLRLGLAAVEKDH